MSGPSVWWLRRDLRLDDNPALHAALDAGEAVLPLFVLDPRLLARSGAARRAWLTASLAAFDAELREAGGPGLSVVEGPAIQAVPAVAAEANATGVHVAADFGPYGARRDAAVADALAGRGLPLVRTGSPYAVAPGTLAQGAGRPYSVFTPFHRAWQAHGVHEPAPAAPVDRVPWIATPLRTGLPDVDRDLVAQVGEPAARRLWREWLARETGGADSYAELHDPPGPDATSRLSVPLRWGHLHPRTVLADLRGRDSPGAQALARQLAWRDFYADVLFSRPDALTEPIRAEFRRMEVDDPASSPLARERLEAWQQGRTGYPMVDAGMRQLSTEAWMHNRVRMLTASFLVKDLHLSWRLGADWFMAQLRDGDVAQNTLNWQWIAGCGLDPAPYVRVFNPTLQGQKFDPDGDYVRRWVPELADLPAEAVHEPWRLPAEARNGYPPPIVDHAEERREALRRYQQVQGR